MKMPSTRRAFGGGYATDCGISMNDSARSKVPGFAATCWKFRDKIIWSWDFGAAALVLIVAVLTPSDAQVVSMSPGLATAALALGGAMVGVVVAALAVIVASSALLVWTALVVFNLVASLQAMGVIRSILARSRRGSG